MLNTIHDVDDDVLVAVGVERDDDDGDDACFEALAVGVILDAILEGLGLLEGETLVGNFEELGFLEGEILRVGLLDATSASLLLLGVMDGGTMDADGDGELGTEVLSMENVASFGPTRYCGPNSPLYAFL